MDTLRRTAIGGLAGALATAPMTLFMAAAFRELPREQRRPLPPRRVTVRAADAAGVAGALGEDARTAATFALHFAYGAGCGAGYALVGSRVGGSRVLAGALFGLAVWTGSYLGWLPVLRLHPPATEEPAGRNALMIGAHLVFGTALALVYDALEGPGRG